MAANTHLIGDKETNNWFKACIGLNVTKEGLTNFLCAELQKVHTVVGRSCGNCPIGNLIQCPTNPYCNKRKRNYCPFHKSQKPQPCPICDNVKHNIMLQHRYGGPSWRNTRAEKWALNYWEIGKCYLPPDGYSSISSVQESDCNGVISIMLNCLHFQTCLSPLCLSPPPPDKQCPLEKVRQIGRDVRHTSDCKVTDADLQDYFKTLSTLLADPPCLQQDPSAIIACKRLSDLQNDRMSFEELGKLLKEVNQTLEEAKKTGKRFSKIAERTLSKHLQKLDATNQLGLIRLKKKTTVGEQRLHSKTKYGEHRLERKTQSGAQRIESSVQHGIERMQQAANKTAQADYERDVADSSSSVSSTLPVCIVLNSANPAKCADPPPLLPCIEWIVLEDITCSSTWLRSLFSTLLTLEQNAVCELTDVSCQGTFILSATLSCLKKTLAYNSDPYLQECDVLWEVLHGLNIKSLSLDTSVINCADMMSQSLSSLTHLDTLSIEVNEYSPGLCKALHGLNIKSLSLSGLYGGFSVDYADSMSQSLSSLTHLDTLSIEVEDDSPGLWEALHGLNIKSLRGLYGGFSVDYADSMSQSLSSLTHLDTLSIEVEDDSPGLWEALHGLNIKSLSLRGRYGKLNVNYADSMSQSLSSLTHLDTLSIEVEDDRPGLCDTYVINCADRTSQSLWLLTHLDTLSIRGVFDDSGLWQALHGLNIKSLSLRGRYGKLNVNYADSMSQSLLSLTHLDTLSIEVDVDSPGLCKALHGLNIKSLSLSLNRHGCYNVKHAEMQAQSLSSLKQLEKLSIFLRTYIDIKLPQSLKYLNIYCVTLLPSELHELVGTLSACTRTVESKLEFGCASFNDFRVKSIPPEEYISIQQELGTLNHVAVKRFRILHRICEYDAASPWSVRGIGGVQDDNTDDDNVNDVAYKSFVTATADPISHGIINRIAMRLLITPSSNS
ncbi:hypothetical protein DPMN_070226 [Dreissena polymorpha]|uniref:Uncharacterized protein n=1 Tax=Dreissena polymorpha TaxID=45954 RepID=A0A9D4BX58_DREPO|nr:hypothetical protein DPMN_070226 [Dreissena polymorpha]